MSYFHSHPQPSFFDVEHQLDKIHTLNDFLVRPNMLSNWPLFLAPLNTLRL
ncbi:MAG: hypothetical protein LBC20_00295 [Planctomycetaceae bacterium]|jgi:hypothetical protein|nr:hypothetical protein [Planctomycetaceae bacterium]